MLEEAETEYQYARVVEEPDGDRELELNEGQAVHSLYRPGSYLTGDYWDEFLVLPFAARPGRRRGGRDPRQRRRHRRARSATSSPPRGRRRRDRPRADASWAAASSTCATRGCGSTTRTRGRSCAAPTRDYDAIMVDVYRQPYIPFYLGDARVLRAGARAAEPGRGGDRERRPSGGPGRPREGAVGHDGARCSRPCCGSERGHEHAGRSAPTAPLRRRGCAARPRACRPTSGRWRGYGRRGWRRALEGGSVYTDDKAPVEWLIDKSIVDYAAHGE